MLLIFVLGDCKLKVVWLDVDEKVVSEVGKENVGCLLVTVHKHLDGV